MPKSLSHLSDEATQETNTANVLTPILTFTPDNGVYWQLKNRVNTGKAPGFPLIMDLRDSGNNQITSDTKVILRVERPEDDEPQAVSVAENNIAPWNTLTQAEQRDEEYIDQVKVELKSSVVNVRENDELTIDVVSADVVDWTNSSVYTVREGVDEFPMG